MCDVVGGSSSHRNHGTAMTTFGFFTNEKQHMNCGLDQQVTWPEGWRFKSIFYRSKLIANFRYMLCLNGHFSTEAWYWVSFENIDWEVERHEFSLLYYGGQPQMTTPPPPSPIFWEKSLRSHKNDRCLLSICILGENALLSWIVIERSVIVNRVKQITVHLIGSATVIVIVVGVYDSRWWH